MVIPMNIFDEKRIKKKEYNKMNEALLRTYTGDINTLSKREKECFYLAVRGTANVDIARLMYISVKTVETHRARINKKLGVHSPIELVLFAIKAGVLNKELLIKDEEYIENEINRLKNDI